MTATPLSIDEQPLHSEDEQQQEASDVLTELPSLSSITRQQTDQVEQTGTATTTTTDDHDHDNDDDEFMPSLSSISSIQRQKTFVVGDHDYNDDHDQDLSSPQNEHDHEHTLLPDFRDLVRRKTEIVMQSSDNNDNVAVASSLGLDALHLSDLTRQVTDKADGDNNDTPHAFASLPNLNEIVKQRTDAADTTGSTDIKVNTDSTMPYLPPRVSAQDQDQDEDEDEDGSAAVGGGGANQYLDSNLVMFDADGRLLNDNAQFINLSCQDIDDDGDDTAAATVEVLDDDSFNQFIEHTQPVICVALNPKQPYQCMSGGQDETCYVWDLVHYDASLKPEEKQSPSSSSPSNVLKFAHHSDTVVDCAWNCTGKYVAAASMDNSVSIYKQHKHHKQQPPQQQQKMMDAQFVCKMEADNEFSFVAWHPNTAQRKQDNNVVMAGCYDKHVYVYQYDKAQKTFVQTQLLMAHSAEIECGGFARYNGAYAYSADKEGMIIIWDGLDQMFGGKKKFAFKPLTESKKGPRAHSVSLYHESGVTCMDDCVGAPLLISGSSDHSVCLLNYETGKVLKKLGMHNDSVECVRFNKAYDLTRKYTNYASSSSLDGCIKIWDLYTMKLRHELQHNDGVICHDWFNTQEYSHLLASGTMNGMVYVWDTRDPSKPVKQYKGHLRNDGGDGDEEAENMNTVQTVQISFDDKYIVSGADDSKVLVWKFE